MGQTMIEVRDLTKTFGAVEAVRGISFRVEAGEIVGFLGPNGAGKTTTMRILAGIFPPTSGEVRIAGHDPLHDPLACRGAVGYFPEYAPFYPDLSVQGYLHFVASLKRIARDARRTAVGRGGGGGPPAELGRRLGRRQRVWLRVEGPGDAVSAVLHGLAGVERTSEQDGAFVVEGALDDLARVVGEAMQRGGWPVRELRQETLDLEEIFLRLVGDGASRA